MWYGNGKVSSTVLNGIFDWIKWDEDRSSTAKAAGGDLNGILSRKSWPVDHIFCHVVMENTLCVRYVNGASYLVEISKSRPSTPCEMAMQSHGPVQLRCIFTFLWRHFWSTAWRKDGVYSMQVQRCYSRDGRRAAGDDKVKCMHAKR